MNNIKYSKRVDAMANIYRASYCIAKNDFKNGIIFIKKSLPLIDDDNRKLINSILKDKTDNRITAEKLCDIYLRMKTF